MQLQNTFTGLPDVLFERQRPVPVESPRLLLFNRPLAQELGLPDALCRDREALAGYFGGNQLLPDSSPIATAYAGHQFGHYSPRLGDGRAHLLGEVIDVAGQRRDIQLKGSGRTRFSRGGDGRCALGPAVREFIMGEAMHALGVPTTRSLAVVTSGEMIFRETPLPGAIVTRVASSHIRIGSFQFASARDDHEALERLCDYAIERHYPELLEQRENRYEAFLDRVIERQVTLVVEWMRVGFIHGVMNTDNTAVSGETIDYGPCAMMSAYDPKTVFSSIDRNGRYAFGNQPGVISWNLARLADSLLPLIDSNRNEAVRRLTPHIEVLPARFEAAFLDMMRRKLGLLDARDDDTALVRALLERLEQQQLDYTVTFHTLGQSLTSESAAADMRAALGDWYGRWQRRRRGQPAADEQVTALMTRSNPVLIPRNHHVEAVLAACHEDGDASAAERFIEVLRSPYEDGPDTARYQDPPSDGDRGYRTFCGT